MAENQEWTIIKDEETGIYASFPRRPVEMAFDIPFQNSPPQGKIKFYSYPMDQSVLILAIYHSPTIHLQSLEEKQFLHFFDTVLVPHLFFDPTPLQNQQFHYYEIKPIENGKAFFQITYIDKNEKKKIEGIAKVNHNALFTSFYLAPEKKFDQKILQHFLDSVH